MLDFDVSTTNTEAIFRNDESWTKSFMLDSEVSTFTSRDVYRGDVWILTFGATKQSKNQEEEEEEEEEENKE